MKGYKRLTKWSELGTLHVFDINGKEIPLCDVSPIDTDNLAGRLACLEDKIESGELCYRQEIRKETAREIMLLLGRGFDEVTGKDFKDLSWYKSFCRELKRRYGVEVEE